MDGREEGHFEGVEGEGWRAEGRGEKAKRDQGRSEARLSRFSLVYFPGSEVGILEGRNVLLCLESTEDGPRSSAEAKEIRGRDAKRSEHPKFYQQLPSPCPPDTPVAKMS